MGAVNPVRVRAMEMLEKGDLPADRADAVRKLLTAQSIKWAEWNNLVEWVRLNRVVTNDRE
jgi:hypothetical protein